MKSGSSTVAQVGIYCADDIPASATIHPSISNSGDACLIELRTRLSGEWILRETAFGSALDRFAV
jgi:hypothetical protein